MGVAGYRISRNGQQVGESPSPGYVDNGLAMNTTYSYTVISVDAAGNVSKPSATASGVTLKVPDTKKPSVPTKLRLTGRSTNLHRPGLVTGGRRYRSHGVPDLPQRQPGRFRGWYALP